MRGGYYVEGLDALILHAFIARSFGVAESAIEIEKYESRPGGFKSALRLLPTVLDTLYNRCVDFVVIGSDNDGDELITSSEEPEDSSYPRHYLHHPDTRAHCRHCLLDQKLKKWRDQRKPYIAEKPPATWPALVAVPVEMVEAWVLCAQALTHPGRGDIDAEALPRSALKRRLYGVPRPTERNIETVALPIVRNPALDLQALSRICKSFECFHHQIGTAQAALREAGRCFTGEPVWPSDPGSSRDSGAAS